MNLAATHATPSWVVFQLLERCNLRCKMCYEWGETGAYHGRNLAELDPALVIRTVDECAHAKPTFEFFGGEPMQYAGLWPVIAHIRRAGCELAFPTNGTLLEAHAEQLVMSDVNRIWISLDGPAEANDRQRGNGVFARVMRGLDRIVGAKRARGSSRPGLGVTCVVTPDNFRDIGELFLRTLDLSALSFVSIELQSFLTQAQANAYAVLLRNRFSTDAAPCAQSYVRDPADFDAIDAELVAAQLDAVARACHERGIQFFSQPRIASAENLRRYLKADWASFEGGRTRCAVPWVGAEISARGEVTLCHTFYDLPMGNIHERSLGEIWNGPIAQQVRNHLRTGLFPICTSCCRFHSGAEPVRHRQPERETVS